MREISGQMRSKISLFHKAPSLVGTIQPYFSSSFFKISGYICAVSCRYFCVPLNPEWPIYRDNTGSATDRSTPDKAQLLRQWTAKVCRRSCGRGPFPWKITSFKKYRARFHRLQCKDDCGRLEMEQSDIASFFNHWVLIN